MPWLARLALQALLLSGFRFIRRFAPDLSRCLSSLFSRVFIDALAGLGGVLSSRLSVLTSLVFTNLSHRVVFFKGSQCPFGVVVNTPALSRGLETRVPGSSTTHVEFGRSVSILRECKIA